MEKIPFSYVPLPEPVPITEQVWPEGTRPLVCTRTMAYMHEKFIRQCIESILMQRTTFPVQVVIHDDASTDSTPDIIREYETKYPQLIKVVYQAENTFSKPDKLQRRVELIRLSNEGRYKALCEGDDYWTDPLKLQKQVEFLESHPEYSLCFHQATTLKAGKEEPFTIPDDVDMENVLFEDLLASTNFIATASVVFRNQRMPLPPWFSKLPFGDLGMHFINSREGKIKCFGESMSVYRIHEGGVWSGRSRTAQLEGWLVFISILWKYLTPGERVIAKERRRNVLNTIAYQRYPNSFRRMQLYGRYLGLVRFLQGR